LFVCFYKSAFSFSFVSKIILSLRNQAEMTCLLLLLRRRRRLMSVMHVSKNIIVELDMSRI